MYRKKFFWAV